VIPWLDVKDPFPPLARALKHPNGLLAAGANLSVQRLVAAYRRGIFPWYSEGEPILWWSPDPRMVLIPGELKVARSLRKRLRKRDYQVRVDTAFEAVMRACAAPRRGQNGTWITQEMIAAYSALNRRAIAHSVETWIGDELAGGLYGVALGRMFFGESMFTRGTDASKIALAHLARQLERWGFGMIDCQMATSHLAAFGARLMPRGPFVAQLAELVECDPAGGKLGPWRFDDDLFD
jgi:leucyl/phenylalanyl-tRNA--protein transferase